MNEHHKLPNADRVVVEIEKLRNYCLNPAHPRGHHKARVFAARLGITREHAELMRIALIGAAWTRDATPTMLDDFGQRYVIDFDMKGPSGTGLIRSSWIVKAGEDFARLTTCYVL